MRNSMPAIAIAFLLALPCTAFADKKEDQHLRGTAPSLK
jgi:hypothetical protein